MDLALYEEVAQDCTFWWCFHSWWSKRRRATECLSFDCCMTMRFDEEFPFFQMINFHILCHVQEKTLLSFFDKLINKISPVAMICNKFRNRYFYLPNRRSFVFEHSSCPNGLIFQRPRFPPECRYLTHYQK